MGTRVAAVCLAVATAFVLGGCGGGSKTIAKADFVKKGNAVCVAEQKKIANLADVNFDPTSQNVTKAQLKQAGDLLDKAIAIQRETITKLRDLGAPKADSGKLDAIYKLADKGANQLHDSANAARAGNLTAFRSKFQTGSNTLGRAQTEINSYGLNKCGNA